MTTATATETLSHTLHPMPPPHGDSAPLSLADIFPKPTPTAPEHRNSMRRFGEIVTPIIQDLALRRLRDE
jgi:hypothetical protein